MNTNSHLNTGRDIRARSQDRRTPDQRKYDEDTASRLTEEMAEYIDAFELNPSATGEGDFVVLDQKVAKENHVNTWATCHTDEDGSYYKVAPDDMFLPQFHYEDMLNFQGMFDSIVDGTPMPDVVQIASKPLVFPYAQERQASVTTASYAESYLLTQSNKYVALDPSRGFLYRCIQGKKSMRITYSEDRKWVDELYQEFHPKFSMEALKLVVIEPNIIDQSDVLYHGLNGFKDFRYNTKNHVCLEPNPYSSEWQKEKCILVPGSHVIEMTYNRKDRTVKYNFDIEPEHFRIDPLSMEKAYAAKQSSCMFFYSYRGLIAHPSMDGSQHESGTQYYLNDLPPFRFVRSLNVSYDDVYVYDVEVCSTAISRRHLVREVAKMLGREIAPLLSVGAYCASPYDRYFHVSRTKSYGKVTVFQTSALQGPPLFKENISTSYNGEAFVFGDFDGRVVSPLQTIGSFYTIPTEGNLRRQPVLSRSFEGRDIVTFESRSVAMKNVMLLIRMAMSLQKHHMFIPVQEAERKPTAEDIKYTTEGMTGDFYTARLPDRALALIKKNKTIPIITLKEALIHWSDQDIDRFVNENPCLHYDTQRLSLSYIESLPIVVGIKGICASSDLVLLRSTFFVLNVQHFDDDLKDSYLLSKLLKYLSNHGIHVVSQIVLTTGIHTTLCAVT